MAGADEGELTPESHVGDVDMILEDEEPVDEPVSADMEQADEDIESDTNGGVAA